MKKITRTATTLAVGLGLAGFLALGATLPAHAANPGPSSNTASATIAGTAGVTGGVVSAADFGTIHLDVSGNTTTADATFLISDIVDATATGDGWSLTFGMTRFTDTKDTLGSGSVTINTAPQLTSDATGSTSPTPINATAPSPGASLDSSATAAVTLFTAGLNEGMGSYSSAQTPLVATLTLPASVHAGLLQSTATVTLTQGIVE